MIASHSRWNQGNDGFYISKSFRWRRKQNAASTRSGKWWGFERFVNINTFLCCKTACDNMAGSLDIQYILVMRMTVVLLRHYTIRYLKLNPQMVVADAGYKTPAIAHQLLEDGIQPLFPYTRPKTKEGFFGKHEFAYDEYYDCYICPGAHILTYNYNKQKWI